MGPNLCILVIQIVFGVIATPVLMAGSAYLLIWWTSVGASIFLLISGILSAAGLFLNILLFRQSLDEWYDPRALNHLKIFSALTGCSSFVASGYYITKAIRVHDDLTLDSYYVSSLSSLLAIILSLWFYSLCRWNKRFVELCDPLLSQPVRQPWRPLGMG